MIPEPALTKWWVVNGKKLFLGWTIPLNMHFYFHTVSCVCCCCCCCCQSGTAFRLQLAVFCFLYYYNGRYVADREERMSVVKPLEEKVTSTDFSAHQGTFHWVVAVVISISVVIKTLSFTATLCLRPSWSVSLWLSAVFPRVPLPPKDVSRVSYQRNGAFLEIKKMKLKPISARDLKWEWMK